MILYYFKWWRTAELVNFTFNLVDADDVYVMEGEFDQNSSNQITQLIRFRRFPQIFESVVAKHLHKNNAINRYITSTVKMNSSKSTLTNMLSYLTIWWSRKEQIQHLWTTPKCLLKILYNSSMRWVLNLYLFRNFSRNVIFIDNFFGRLYSKDVLKNFFLESLIPTG